MAIAKEFSSIKYEKIERTGDGTIFEETKIHVTADSLTKCRDVVKEFLKL